MKTAKTVAATAPDPLQPAQPEAYYNDLFDKLGEAYWAASATADKDQIQAARDAILQILRGIAQQKLAQDTAQMLVLQGLVARTNKALEQLEQDIAKIVKKIELAGDVEAAIAKVISLAGKVM